MAALDKKMHGLSHLNIYLGMGEEMSRNFTYWTTTKGMTASFSVSWPLVDLNGTIDAMDKSPASKEPNCSWCSK